MAYRVGVDIGGTFTDLCAFDDTTNALHTLKVLSTPDKPGSEVMEGLRQLQQRYSVAPEQITYFTHGTTVGVNTVIQRKGIKLCLFVTENFVDVLEVARLKMPDPYDLRSKPPEPLVRKDCVLPVRERVRSDGSIDTPLDETSVLAALMEARALGAEGIVIAFINAYRNPVHEHAAKQIVEQAAPGLPVFCSTDVWSVIREYERTTTAVIHGYVQPRVAHYLGSLQDALRGAGVPATAMVTKSNGGVMSAELGKTACAQMILSGTASGVIGASFIATQSGFPKTMSLDVGGTSADVAFIEDGTPQYGVGEMIGDFPIYIPTVAVTSIGAGGGSIAWVDPYGVLKVGPESAGSTPGPACYSRGGTRPTITDAFAVLGYLGSGELGYSAIKVDVDKARAAIDAVAARAGLERVPAAEAIIRIAVSGMYLEISKLVSRYGLDPRDYALQAFGGAGPMTACFLAREIGMRHVVVPTTPGVLSALGGLIADIKSDFIATVFVGLDESALPKIRDSYAVLEANALRWLREEQRYDGPHSFVYSADMRYHGQSYEIETVLDADAVKRGDLAALATAFHERHRQVYDHADPEAPVQIINLRLVVIGRNAKPTFAPAQERKAPAVSAEMRRVFLDGAERDVPVFARADLKPGQFFASPAIVTQSDCTTCIPAGFDGRVDAYGNLILTFDNPA